MRFVFARGFAPVTLITDQCRDPPLTYNMCPRSSSRLSSTTTSCASESRHSRSMHRTLSAQPANSSASTSSPPSSASMRAAGEQALQVAALLEAEDHEAGDGNGGEKLRAGFIDWHRVRLRPERSRRQDRVWRACRWLANVRSSPPSYPERTGRIRPLLAGWAAAADDRFGSGAAAPVVATEVRFPVSHAPNRSRSSRPVPALSTGTRVRGAARLGACAALSLGSIQPPSKAERLRCRLPSSVFCDSPEGA